ncbi:unnamed protein product [Rangifer tarandus platyrhynchus]|uniref:Uncharacterized protein n=1 Tax=Rangifer tarandus platyrhynchus TaxID=3082113 RepID=A0AC59ZMB3_RANTA
MLRAFSCDRSSLPRQTSPGLALVCAPDLELCLSPQDIVFLNLLLPVSSWSLKINSAELQRLALGGASFCTCSAQGRGGAGVGSEERPRHALTWTSAALVRRPDSELDAARAAGSERAQEASPPRDARHTGGEGAAESAAPRALAPGLVRPLPSAVYTRRSRRGSRDAPARSPPPCSQQTAGTSAITPLLGLTPAHLSLL